MAKSRNVAHWDIASPILAVLMNGLLKRDGGPVSPDDLHPYRPKVPKPTPVADPKLGFRLLKKLFVRPPPRKRLEGRRHGKRNKGKKGKR